LILKTAVEHSKTPFALSPSALLRRALSKGERGFGMLTEWVNMRKPFMLRQGSPEFIEGLSTNGLQALQLRFLGLMVLFSFLNGDRQWLLQQPDWARALI
jgi:hypothetical protein